MIMPERKPCAANAPPIPKITPTKIEAIRYFTTAIEFPKTKTTSLA